VQIDAGDRDYVAREMMAFLVSWISSLRCPVINQPTPVNLTGPAWRQEQWTYAAAQLGIRVHAAKRHVGSESDQMEPAVFSTRTDVTVVGDRCFGEVDERLFEQSRKLAKTAGVALLKISFSGSDANSFFLDADLMPKLSDYVADAVLEHLLTREARAA